MADEVDMTAEKMEVMERYQINGSRKPNGPMACGACHFCSTPLPEGKVFCDADCRDDYEREQRQRMRQGRDF